MSELWDLYDGYGIKTGNVMTRGEEVPKGLYHLAVHIWPFNNAGEILIEKRASTVTWKPNCWAATGGSAIAGETPLRAALRELREEIGYSAKPEEMIRINCLRRTNSFCSVYMIHIEQKAQDFRLQKEEVSRVEWFNREHMASMIFEGKMYNYGDAYNCALWDKLDELAALRRGDLKAE